MGEARDTALTGPLLEELACSRAAANAAEAGDLEGVRAPLHRALTLSKGTHRETGYRLRLHALDAGETVVRLSEK